MPLGIARMPGVNIGVFCSTPAVGLVKHRPEARYGRVAEGTEGKLDAEIRRFTDIILSWSSAAICFAKQSFYGQIDRPLEAACGVASKVMGCNMLLEDAAEGIDAFLQKRPASWRGK
jgi:enoyl-CoA hydratase/carnithine racemase